MKHFNMQETLQQKIEMNHNLTPISGKGSQNGHGNLPQNINKIKTK